MEDYKEVKEHRSKGNISKKSFREEENSEVKKEIEGISKRLDRSVDRATSLHDRTSTSRLLSKNLLHKNEKQNEPVLRSEERKEFQLGQYIANHSVLDENLTERNLLMNSDDSFHQVINPFNEDQDDADNERDSQEDNFEFGDYSSGFGH